MPLRLIFFLFPSDFIAGHSSSFLSLSLLQPPTQLTPLHIMLVTWLVVVAVVLLISLTILWIRVKRSRQISVAFFHPYWYVACWYRFTSRH
jgi:hypothetical protein